LTRKHYLKDLFRRGMFSATLGQEVQGWCKLK